MRPEQRVARRVRELRKLLGLTQAQLAEQLVAAGHDSAHKSTVSKIEANRRGISVDELVQLAEALHTTPARLLADDETAPDSEVTYDAVYVDVLLRFLRDQARQNRETTARLEEVEQQLRASRPRWGENALSDEDEPLDESEL